MKSRVSLRRYLALHLSLVVALPMALIAVLVWQVLMPQIRGAIAIHHESLARAVAGQVSAHLAGGERQLIALAEFLEARRELSPEQTISLLDAHCGQGDLFEAIYLVSNGDHIIRSVGLARPSRLRRDDLMGMDVSGQGFAIASRGPKTLLWSKTFLSTVSSHLAVALSIQQAESTLIGEIGLDRLSELIARLPAKSGLTTLILDRRGRIVADAQQARTGRQIPPETLSAVTKDSDPGSGSRLFELDGQRLFGTVVSVDHLGWKVLVAQPMESAFKPQRAAMMLIGFGLAAALVLGLLSGWLQAGNLARLFRLYADNARAIAGGKYDGLFWPSSRTREFDHLSRSIQSMSQTIGQREAALVAKETDIRITLDSIGDAVIATDADGRVVRMNPIAEKLTGWPLAEAEGRPLTEVFRIVNALTRQPAPNPVEKVLALGQIVGLANHTLLIAKDGREYQIADSGAPIRQADGPIMGVVLVFRDVTEAYAREQKIRENERMLDDITTNVPGVVFQFRVTGRHVHRDGFVSAKAWDIFGLTAEHVRFFERFVACIPEAERKRFLDSVYESADKVAPWQYEGRFIRPDGKTIWFSGHATPRKDGDTVMSYGVLLDITRRRHLEESLHLTRFIFDKASIGIFRIGLDGKILDVNEQVCRSLGYSAAELCQMKVFDIDPDFSPRQWPQHLETVRRQKSDLLESRQRHKDGTVFPVRVLVNLVTYEDQEYHVAFVEDISERERARREAQRLQEALSQAQKMEAIGTLAGGIAHDFNNILAAIIGYTELALPQTASQDRLHRYLEQIQTAGLRARDLVQQILTFSRRDERKLRPLQPAPLVKEALRLLRSSLPTTIEIRQAIAADTLPVLADPTQIHQIVMNLCTNAAHAMEADGGRLDVRLEQVRLSAEDVRLEPGLRPGDYLRFTVADTGPGIAPEILARIFDPYFTTKPKGKGTGLGLAVVHGIVQSYGGSISVDSQAGSGATFTVYLPAAEKQINDEPKKNGSLPGGSEHVLLVDDEPVLIDVGRQMLEAMGYRVTTCEGSMAALELVRAAPRAFDLVITDMTMPQMTGDRLAAQLLKIRPDLPIVINTGYSNKISAEKAAAIGVKAFVHKPLVMAELATAVRKVLDENPEAH